MSDGLAGSGLSGVDDQLFYDDLVAGYVQEEGYERREWLEAEVQERLARPDCRYVLLVGEPGAGKTGLMAGLADGHPDWLRYFIRRDSTTPLSGGDAASALIRTGHQFATRQPAAFDVKQLEVVVNQRVRRAGPGSSVIGVRIEDLQVSPFHRTALSVTQEVGELAGRLVGVEVTHATVEPRLLVPETLQYLALLDPAAVLQTSKPGTQVVVLVDALDEVVRFRGGMSVLDWLERGPELPSNVRFVLSSRPHPRLEVLKGVRAGGIELITLHAGSTGVLEDARRFATRMLAAPPAATHVPDIDAKADRVARASEGNFAYLRAFERALLSAIREGSDAMLDALLRLEVLPKGLGGLYAVFLRNVREEINQLGALDVEHPTGPSDTVTPAWEGAGQRMLGVLAVARAPLTLEQIMRLGAIRVWRSGADSVLQRLTPFLDELSGTWRYFHPSVAEFLTRGAAQEAPDLGVEGAEWHRRVVGAYRHAAAWDQVDWQSVDDYGILHLAEHLVELGDGGRKEIPALVNPGLRAAARKRFLTDLPFKRIVDTALAGADEQVDPGRALATTIFLDLVRTNLRSSGRWLAPAVFGLMARLRRFDEALARAELLPPGEHQFASLQALVACAPPEMLPLLGGHDGVDRLVSAALEVAVNDGGLFPGMRRNSAIEAAALALAPYDLERALTLAAQIEGDRHEVPDKVLAAAARTSAPAAVMGLLDRMHGGRAAVAVEAALRADPHERTQLLLIAEQHLKSEPIRSRISALAGAVAGWLPSDPERAGTAAGALRDLIQAPPPDDSSSDLQRAALDAATTVRDAEPALASWLLDRIGDEHADSSASWEITRAARLWAAWGEPEKCRDLAERVLAYERGLGWYGPAAAIAELAVAVAGAHPEWAQQLADEAESLIATAASEANDDFERSRVDGKLAQVARAFRTWDRERALRMARLMGGGWISGGSWDSFDGRLSALACIGIDAAHTDIDLARQLLQECALDDEPSTVLGRPDARLIRGGLFRPAEDLGRSQAPLTRVTNYVAYLANAVNDWVDGRDWRPFAEPAGVARSVQMVPGSVGSFPSWASVISAAIGPVAAHDLDRAIDLAGWPADPCERLIACAALARALTDAGDERAAGAVDALGRAAIALPRYVAEVDLDAVPSGPVLAYLDPTKRARWEAALQLPLEATATSAALAGATGSWYLDVTRRGQLMFESLLSPVPDGTSCEAVIEGVTQALASVESHPDDIQLDLVRAAAAWALAPCDPSGAEALASEMEHPGRALLARLYAAAGTAADAGSLLAACRAVFDAAPAALSPLHRAAATAHIAGLVARSDTDGARDLVEAGVTALEDADALAAAYGYVLLATVLDGPRRAELVHMALQRADDIGHPYLRNEVLPHVLVPAALTGDTSLLTTVARRLLAADWQVLMEGLRGAIGPLLVLAGPELLNQMDEALRMAQRVLATGANAEADHLDGVAAPQLRLEIPSGAAPVPPGPTIDLDALYLSAEDLPEMQVAQDSRDAGPDPGDYAFAPCEGRHSGFQVWLADDTRPVWRLVDIRFVFPDVERAAAYHAERLLANSEGNPPVAGAPVAGQDCHVFGGTQDIGLVDRTMTMYFYVFRVGAVVVKLFVAQGLRASGPLPPEPIHAIAQRIVAKLTTAS